MMNGLVESYNLEVEEAAKWLGIITCGDNNYKIEKDEESASTSTGNASSCCPTTSKVAVSVPVSTCWNCEEEMTVTHQCITSPSSCLPPPLRTTPTLEVLSPAAARLRPDPSAPYIIKGKIRHLDGSPNVTPRPKK